MLIFNNKVDLNKHLQNSSSKNTIIGFVPTMGALHEGHLSLLTASLANNTITIISIFVNPTQFNNLDDLNKYPRNFESDLAKIASVSSEIIVYTPTVEDIYNGQTKSEHFNYDGLENQMEGKFRPGHFDGVGTVVKLLFEIVKPAHAYFGEKDFQQLQIVKKLVDKEQIPVIIVECSIFREPNGLAMSSRNERLTSKEREEAKLIYKTLLDAKKIFMVKSAKTVSDFVTKTFTATTFKLEYFEIANEANLKSCVRKNKNKKYRAFIAVFVNNIRLIDTISLG